MNQVIEAERLAQAQRVARIGSWDRDLQTGRLSWSDEMFQVYGLPDHSTAPTPDECLATVLADDRAATHAAFERAVAEGIELDVTHRVQPAGGALRHVRVKGRVTADPEGRPLRAFGTAQDVTASVLREIDLRGRETRLRSVLSTLSEGVVVQAADGSVTDANPAAERILGLSRDELMGRTSVDPRWRSVRIDGSPMPGMEHPAMVALATGEAQRDRVMGIDSPGSGRRWINVNATPIADGGKTTGVVATFVDITAQRLLAAEVTQSVAELEDLYDHSPAGHYALNPDRTFAKINARLLAWLGRPREELLGRMKPTDFMTPESLPACILAFQELKDKGEVRDLRCELLPVDGVVRHVSISATASRDAHGRFALSRSVMHDITAEVEAAGRRLALHVLDAENAKLRDLSRLKSLFLANMSHELRTPLNAIIGLTTLLGPGFAKLDSPRSARYVEQIGASGQHLLQLIESMLDFANSESGKLEFHPEPVNPARIAEDVIELLRSKMDRRKIRVSIEHDPFIEDVEVDPMRLRQVLVNLVHNAIKFSHEEGRISVRTSAEGTDRFRIEIEDWGIGIAEADLSRLFTQFDQLSSGHTKKFEGTGMGLALVKRLIEAQGGTVEVSSELGRGSVFRLSMPRRPAFNARSTPNP